MGRRGGGGYAAQYLYQRVVVDGNINIVDVFAQAVATCYTHADAHARSGHLYRPRSEMRPGNCCLKAPYKGQDDKQIRKPEDRHDFGARPKPQEDEDESHGPCRKRCRNHAGTIVAVVQIGRGRPRCRAHEDCSAPAVVAALPSPPFPWC